jgi:hypothetical protein
MASYTATKAPVVAPKAVFALRKASAARPVAKVSNVAAAGEMMVRTQVAEAIDCRLDRAQLRLNYQFVSFFLA